MKKFKTMKEKDDIPLICFPHAGAFSSFFYKWKMNHSYSDSLIPIDYPGHGKKLALPLGTSIEKIIENILLEIGPFIKNNEFALFGHSMGAIIAYELCCELQSKQQPLPSHLFLSAINPRVSPGNKKMHLLPTAEFIEEIKNMGGPIAALENQEILNFMLPILRSDMRIAENWIVSKSLKLDISTTVFYGSHDPLMINNKMELWQNHFNFPVELMKLTGGHFFLNDHVDLILEKIYFTLN